MKAIVLSAIRYSVDNSGPLCIYSVVFQFDRHVSIVDPKFIARAYYLVPYNETLWLHFYYVEKVRYKGML